MTLKRSLTPVNMLCANQEQNITNLFTSGAYTVEDMSTYFNVSTATMGRVLARLGLIERSDVKSIAQEQMLEYLKANNIVGMDSLKRALGHAYVS